MAEPNLTTPISRRRALTLGGGIAATGGVLSGLGPFTSAALGHGREKDRHHHDDHRHHL